LPLLKINYNTTTELHLKPTFEVKQTYTDFLVGEDSIWDFAKSLIEK
jgi:hypothetical protein